VLVTADEAVAGVVLVVLFAVRGVIGAGFSFEALVVFAGKSFSGVVVAFVVAPGSGGSSGRSGIVGTVAEVLEAFDAAAPELFAVDLFAAGSVLATGIVVGGGVTVGTAEGQAGALLSVDSDAPFVAASDGTPSGG
jgi:hypothetical protein